MTETTSQQIISISNVSKRFGTYLALDNVSLNIPKGKIFGLLGPNGAGKTTLIRMLTGITAPDEGTIEFLFSQNSNSLGYLPEERGLYRKMKVWEQAIYLTQLKGIEKIAAGQQLQHWFSKMEMNDWKNKTVESLSKGMQQRLQFVITVASNPDVLILDEPFSGFDPINAEQLKNEILNLHDEGKTIILSTHNMASVEELCSNVCLINQGKIILNDSLSQIKNTYKKSIFEIVFEGSQVAFANSIGFQFEIIKIHNDNGLFTATIKSHDKVSSNQLLSALLQSLSIKSFREVLPSMNDIFIDLVGQETEKSKIG